MTLNQPNQSVQVTSAFTPPQAVQLTPDQVQQRFGGVLESLPPSPAATQETQETEGAAATEEAVEEEEEEEEEGEEEEGEGEEGAAEEGEEQAAELAASE